MSYLTINDYYQRYIFFRIPPFSLDHLLLLRFIKNNQICINFKYHLVAKIWGGQKKYPVFLIRNAFNK